MFSELLLDSEDKNVTNFADYRKSINDSHIIHTLGYKQTKKAVEKQNDIKTTDCVLTPRYVQLMNKFASRYLFAGQSLCGKSTVIGMIMRSYKQQYPKNNIFLFSPVEDDEALDKYKPIRITLDVKFIDDPIQLHELKNSLCVFDDVDNEDDEDVCRAVCKLRDRLMGKGRHATTACISSDQILFKGKQSVKSILGANYIVLFPVASIAQTEQFLKDKLRLPKKTINKICSLRTRWIMVHRNTPMYVLYENGFFFI